MIISQVLRLILCGSLCITPTIAETGTSRRKIWQLGTWLGKSRGCLAQKFVGLCVIPSPTYPLIQL